MFVTCVQSCCDGYFQFFIFLILSYAAKDVCRLFGDLRTTLPFFLSLSITIHLFTHSFEHIWGSRPTRLYLRSYFCANQIIGGVSSSSSSSSSTCSAMVDRLFLSISRSHFPIIYCFVRSSLNLLSLGSLFFVSSIFFQCLLLKVHVCY